MKIYPKYGKVFKILRKQRGFKLTSFTQLGISAATLCKFENGKTMLRLDKLVVVLSEMSIGLGEYEKFYNNFETTLDESLIQKTINAWISGNAPMLEILYEDASNLGEKACALAIKSLYEEMKLEEIEWLYEYFDKVQFWRTIDLYSLYLTLEFFKERQILYLLDVFFTDIFHRKMINSIEYKVDFIHIICRAIFILSFRGHKQVTTHLLDYINPQNFSHTMYTRNLYELTLGYWTILFGDSKQGEEQLNRALLIFKELCPKSISRYFEYILKKYLAKRGNREERSIFPDFL